ncbi:hypothetical protein Hypma_007984 [Hypsizygus marmoreus]|uniref:Uncharacterized protein n=1 Tax=Hypsizygus marmoreus TaxID=39966 RepID=A0A369JZV6_HYPMA|nr:hypothetical protein Hypma_007984 [Hypsizygus marmoreus]
MIISGDNAKLLPKGPASSNVSNAEASTAHTEPPPYQATSGQYTVREYVVAQQAVYRQSPMRRFCNAFVVAIFIWLLMSLLVQSIVDLAHWSHRHGHYNLQDFWMGEFPVPSEVTLVECVTPKQWSGEHPLDHLLSPLFPPSSPDRYPYASETEFELPLSYKNLFLLSRGPQTHGTLNIVTSDVKSDVAKVHLVMKYFGKDDRDFGAKTCLIKRSNSEIGVGIFTRRWAGYDPGRHMLRFEATVVLPESGNLDKPLQLESFESDIPNSNHNVGDLQSLVNFQYISLKGSNAPIRVKSLHAHKAVIQTSNSPIEGVFNASRSLTLRTSNAPIRVDVGINNDKDYISDLVMRTSNSKLDATVSLTSVSSKGGRYLVTASTSNSPLRVDFAASPLDSTLKLEASTSNSPASVSLDPAYEGTFSLTTSLFAPTLIRHQVDDPSGKGRERIIETNSFGRNVLKGSVKWAKQQGQGSVSIRSSNAPVTLEL